MANGFQTLPQESAFANWARRLIIGPRSIVERQLADIAESEREEQKAQREAATFPQRMELATASTREGHRLATEEAQRKEQKAQGEREGLSTLAKWLRGEVPGGLDVPSVTEADLLRYPLTETQRKMLLPEPEKGIQLDPTKPLVSPTTGKVIRPAETKVGKQPEPFTDYNPVTQEPRWNEGKSRWDIVNKSVTDMELLASQAARLFKGDQAKQEEYILAQSLERQQKIAGVKETGKTVSEEAERAKQPFHRAYKDQVLVNRLTLANESIKAPTVGAADAMALGGTHKLLSKDETKVYRDGLEAVSLAKDIRATGERIFTGKTKGGVVARGVWVGAESFFDLGLGKEYNNLQQQMGRVMKLVRMMQGEARISDSDLKIIGRFVSVENLFQSAQGFSERATLVERVVKEGLRRTVEGITVPADAGLTLDATQEIAQSPIVGPTESGKKLQRIPPTR